MHDYAYRTRACGIRGFTLINLMLSLAIATIAMTIGVPAFKSLGARGQLTAEINSLVRHLHLTRSYAIKTGINHVLCPSADGVACLGSSQWDQGYILFQDGNRDGVRDPGEELMQTYRSTSGIAIGMQSTRGRIQVTYRQDGFSVGSNLTLTFCDPEKGIPPKAVILSNTGRTRVSTTRWDGSPLSCSP
jgi:type IV fimbrial biogenesis protein FimT